MKIDFKNYNNVTTQDHNIPSAGIESIDRAVFNLFDKKISFEAVIDGSLKKVPVVFAAGERFALTRRNSPIRDKNNTLILPIISIVRGAIDFSPAQSNRGTAIAPRDQAPYIIKKRLAKSDRAVQNILNKSNIRNQDNVAVAAGTLPSSGSAYVPNSNRLTTRRTPDMSNLENLNFSKVGGSVRNIISNPNLSNDLNRNIFEIITVPYPTFIAISYKVTFWCQYMTQMNAIQETYLSEFRGQGEEFLVKTEEGYEYVIASSTTFTADTNFSDYTESERIIKSSIDLTVPGYIINPKQPGLPNQLRSTFSAPFIEFGYFESKDQVIVDNETKNNDVDKFILNDVSTDQDLTKKLERGQSSESIRNVIVNPFTKEEEVQYSKVLTRNDRSGETVASNLIIKKIETQFK